MDPTQYIAILEAIGGTLLAAYDRHDTEDGWVLAHGASCPADPCDCGADELRTQFARLTAALLLGCDA
jgi:hypothetical protein